MVMAPLLVPPVMQGTSSASRYKWYFMNFFCALCVHMQDKQDRGCGTTDGTYRNERYFVCDDKCGLFVALDKLAMDPEGNILEKPPRGGQSYAKATSHGTVASSRSYPQNGGPLADNAQARGQAITKRPTVHGDPLPRFKNGDRVVAFDRKGNRIHGTVRWAGKNETARKCTFLVGIETVSHSHLM